MKKSLYVLLPLFVLLAGYYFWSESGRVRNTEDIYPRYVLGSVEQFGKNTGKGNLLVLSPYLHTYDFSSKQAFENMLRYYFSFAKRKELLRDSTVVILPEYLGTWLVAANAKKSIYSDTSMRNNLKLMAFSDPLSFAVAYLNSRGAEEAVFRMHARNMLSIYQQTFSALAKEFNVTIVAGSVVLPDPFVKDGKIEIHPSGKIYNVSAVFDPSGNVLSPLTKKIFPIEEEKAFTCSAEKNSIPVYSVPAGKLAVLVCADSWYPDNYQYLADKKVDILAVPSFVTGDSSWSKLWNGYDGAPLPADVDRKDIGKISEREAWMKYAMCGRAASAHIKTGATAFLRGDLWNLGSDGHTLILTDSIHEAKDAEAKTGTLINVWLE